MIIINTRRTVLSIIVLIAAMVFVCAAVSAAPESKPKPKDAAEEKAESPQISVGQKGSYVYWFTYTDADGVAQSTLPVRFKGKSTDLDAGPLGEKFSKAKLYVMNKATGNLAIADFAPGKSVDLPADEFQYIRTVRLRIVAEDGKPIESAIVRISDGMSEKHLAIVTPADEGVATFSNVATGEITVKVEAENLRKTINSDITVSDKRDTPNYQRDIKVAGDVNTLNIEPESKTSSKAGKKAEPKASSWVSVLQTISGLLILIVAIAVIAIVLKSKGLTGRSALKSLGVELPDEQKDQAATTPAAPAVDPNVCQFCGQTKDANGNCACSVVPGAAAAPSTSSPGVPRLIGSQGAYAGHIFELTAPSMTIGREAGNPIALVEDSTASRRHATISESGGTYTIRDEGSANGTFVNGARVTEKQLSPGDEIQIGGTKFRFEI